MGMALWHRLMLGSGSLVVTLCTNSALAQAPMPSQEEMWRLIQEQAQQLEVQRKEIDTLKRVADAAPGVAKEAVRPKSPPAPSFIPATLPSAPAMVVPAQGSGVATAPATASRTAMPGGGWWDRTSIGGYGELHYEGGARDQIDFHRFVLFFGHEFNSRTRFLSEIEIEHALAAPDTDGEVGLEQGYLQFDLFPQARLNAGLQLIPVGFLNEVHEPPNFYGVERNSIESRIIPTTWSEAGVGLNGFFGDSGLGYDVLVSSGLSVPLTGADAFRVRDGRKHVSEAPANAPALTGRLKYTGILGVELATTAHYEFDLSQGAGDPISGEEVPGWLISAQAAANYGGFGLRALYASWSIDGVSARAMGRDEQTGYYIEPSYRFSLSDVGLSGDAGELGLYYRYGWWDNNAGRSSLGLATTQHSFGANYWPTPDIVFKLDYIWEKLDSGAQSDRLNAGLGYQF